MLDKKILWSDGVVSRGGAGGRWPKCWNTRKEARTGEENCRLRRDKPTDNKKNTGINNTGELKQPKYNGLTLNKGKPGEYILTEVITNEDQGSRVQRLLDFLLKHGVHSNPNALPGTKIPGCMNLCVGMNPSTFPFYIPINEKLSAPDSSLSTPLLKYPNHLRFPSLRGGVSTCGWLWLPPR